MRVTRRFEAACLLSNGSFGCEPLNGRGPEERVQAAGVLRRHGFHRAPLWVSLLVHMNHESDHPFHSGDAAKTFRRDYAGDIRRPWAHQTARDDLMIRIGIRADLDNLIQDRPELLRSNVRDAHRHTQHGQRDCRNFTLTLEYLTGNILSARLLLHQWMWLCQVFSDRIFGSDG